MALPPVTVHSEATQRPRSPSTVRRSRTRGVHPNAAGIDVGNDAHYVAVRRSRPNPSRGSTASRLISIAWPIGWSGAA